MPFRWHVLADCVLSYCIFILYSHVLPYKRYIPLKRRWQYLCKKYCKAEYHCNIKSIVNALRIVLNVNLYFLNRILSKTFFLDP